MRFEERLGRTVLILATMAGGCVGGTSTKDSGTDTDTGIPTTEVDALCDGGTSPEGYFVDLGFVEIAPGGKCPSAEDAVLDVYACTFWEWQATCGFDHVARDQVQVSDGYGSWHVDAASAPSTTTGSALYVGPVVDVCFYEGVFLDRDETTCGRPLLRDGAPVLAQRRPGDGRWATEARPDVDGLTDAERAAVGDYWLGAARLEHASVASFAVVALDLMRFGAPPELLAGTHQAAVDEVAHARLCFSLASGYLGAAEGPGALDASGAGASTLAEVAAALLREGCVGETLAAVDAAARLGRATDPAVRAALEIIVRDESAHAALAWRTLAWILREDPSIREHLAPILAEERARWAAPSERTVSRAAEGHGLLSGRARAAALDRAWRDVIDPAWAGLGQPSGVHTAEQ